jgi:hypothetical protein
MTLARTPVATGPARNAAPRQRATSSVAATAASWTALGTVVVWNLWVWRSELTGVAYLDDSSVHEQMVRFAAQRIRAGHLPLTSWFPYLGLGSPNFEHYQSLPSMITGLLGTAVGGDTAFRWSVYLLLALWPLCVYWSARIFELSRPAAACAAAASGFLASAVGVGYEPKAYVWIGYGVWAQLWASWALPPAWAFTWRAMSSRRAVLPAVVFVALTAALHFETGYLAFIPIVVFPFLVPSELRGRIVRAVVVGVGAVLASAWVIVPLIAQGRWAATNEILAGTPLENGYGARRVLSWLVSGQLYDAGRFPVVTILVGVGIVVCVRRWRTNTTGRAFVALWVMSLVLSFGRTTFGSLTALLPGSTDIFMRRFMMGAQLAGLYLAAVGAVTLGRLAWTVAVRRWPSVKTASATYPGSVVLAAVGCVVGIAVLIPAWSQMGTYAHNNTSAIDAQHADEAAQASEVDRLVAFVRAHGGGRVYAGMPSNWGATFTVGMVPVFKFLESRDIDEVGYTLRTASLMTDPEYYFDESNAGDYSLFAIHYLMLPIGHSPPVPAHLVMTSGPYQLWVVPATGYVRVVDSVGVLDSDRSDVGSASVPYLRSSLPAQGGDLAVAYAGAAPGPVTVREDHEIVGAPGEVRAEHDNLAAGSASATVVAARPAVVALSASFDAGWQVDVDGHRATPEMLAPAIVGVPVTAGRHTVVFHYGGYGWYPVLLIVLVVTLAALVLWCAPRRRTSPDVAP